MTGELLVFKQNDFMIDSYKLYKQAWIFSKDSHLESELHQSVVNSLLGLGGVIVRNTYNFDCLEETSFWYVIKDTFGGMEELSSKMRNQIKRCFRSMRVERISRDFLLNNGYEVFVRAAESYAIKLQPPTREEFAARIRNAAENEYWGVIDIETENLVAFSMNFVSDESCEYRTMKAIPEYQKRYAYYGLIYEMNRYYLDEQKLKYVNDGARSITGHSNIQPFLIDKFKFRKAYCHIKVHYKWWFGLLVKILYPFRKLILNRKVKAILDMETMARNNKS